MRNGIALSALSEYAHEIRETPAEGVVSYGVSVDWQTGTRARASAMPMCVGPHKVSRNFEWTIDEPRQLLGSNHAPNPQEYLLSGLGACIMVGFVVGASVMEIQLESLSVKVEGELDLAGFLGVTEGAPIPFSEIRYTIEVAGDGTPEQFEELREKAVSHSPNAMTIASSTPLKGALRIAEPA